MNPNRLFAITGVDGFVVESVLLNQQLLNKRCLIGP